MDEHLVQDAGVGKRRASCGLCGIKQLQLTLGELRWTTQLIKLAHCAVMKKNPCYKIFRNVAMHNGLGSTHKTLWVNLPMVINHHEWLPPYVGNNVFLLPKVQGKCSMWRTYGPC